MATYSLTNSLAPMIFRTKNKKDRKRSRSLENIVDDIPETHPLRSRSRDRAKTSLQDSTMNKERTEWDEIPLVKSTSPVVMCVLPAIATDFVCSVLLAIGATPLVTEDPLDMEKDIQNSKAIVVDTCASRGLLEAFLEHYVLGQCPLMLVASQAGSNDRRKEIAQRIIADCGPTVITGKLGDIYAVSQDVIEKACSPELSDSDSSGEQGITVNPPPKVVVAKEERSTSLPPALRRFRVRGKSPSPAPTSAPPVGRSPSPRVSPVSSPRGVRKRIEKKGGPMRRVPTALPMVRMKGQFRDASMADVTINDALERGQLLAAHTDAFVHLYCTNVVTNGEVVVELTNNQLGMGNLHSTLPCSAAVLAAVLACVEGRGDEITVKHCTHALALYYVAAEEAAGCTTQACEKGTIIPGTLRTKFIDALYNLDEEEVRLKAAIYAHTSGTS